MVESRRRRDFIQRDREAIRESAFWKGVLILGALSIMSLLLILPLVIVFSEALSHGIGAYLQALIHPETRGSILTTLFVAAFCVPINALFGIAAAWAIARFEFRGKALLVTMIDLPFSISPVVAGLSIVLLGGGRTPLGVWLEAHGISFIFALPGMIFATLLVTFPFVARQLIPLMQQQGSEDEQVALTLGASSFRMFVTLTLPNIKWSLLYGILLCNARAMGEFGAVSVVSGHIRGITHTMPLQIEAFYGDYNQVAAFTVASLLALLALVTLGLKTILEWRFADELSLKRHG